MKAQPSRPKINPINSVIFEWILVTYEKVRNNLVEKMGIMAEILKMNSLATTKFPFP